MLRIVGTVLAMLAAGTGYANSGADLTRAYLNAYNDSCAFGAAQAKSLRAYKVLLVPGYLSDLYPNYFEDQLRWLSAIGVEHEKLPIKSGESIDINGPIIAAAIERAAKPVILITHSKGSVDTLEALLADAKTRKQVKGWISLQGSFFGSPVADKLLDGSLLNPLVANLILGFFGGTQESALSLTTRASSARYRERAPAIAPLLRTVPALAFASAIDRSHNDQASTTLEIPYELMTRDGIRNDGMVPLDAAVLPGMDFVRISGVDHVATVMPARRRLDRVRMTQALLLTLLAPLRGLPRDAHCTKLR